ncbi:MAG: ACT domain-containing protein [Clostridia bacterium]
MKAIVSVIGKDKTGIIAKVATALSNMRINIEDISQTIMQNQFFTMIMMIGLGDNDSIEDINEKLQVIAREMGVEINVRHEDIFNSMHRI